MERFREGFKVVMCLQGAKPEDYFPNKEAAQLAVDTVAEEGYDNVNVEEAADGWLGVVNAADGLTRLFYILRESPLPRFSNIHPVFHGALRAVTGWN